MNQIASAINEHKIEFSKEISKEYVSWPKFVTLLGAIALSILAAGWIVSERIGQVNERVIAVEVHVKYVVEQIDFMQKKEEALKSRNHR